MAKQLLLVLVLQTIAIGGLSLIDNILHGVGSQGLSIVATA